MKYNKIIRDCCYRSLLEIVDPKSGKYYGHPPSASGNISQISGQQFPIVTSTSVTICIMSNLRAMRPWSLSSGHELRLRRISRSQWRPRLQHDLITHQQANSAAYPQWHVPCSHGLLSLYPVGAASTQWKIGGGIFNIWTVIPQESHWNLCHQMPRF